MLSSIIGRINTVYVDLDGVLVNFLHGIYELFDVPQTFRKLDDCDDLESLVRIPEREIWRVIESKGPDWWLKLPYYPWYRQLRSAVIESGMEFVIVTSPAKSAPSSGTGKMKWIKRYLNSTFIKGNFILTGAKYRLARPDALLIDDTISKVSDFRDAGGRAILFPQPYNQPYNDRTYIELRPFGTPQELIEAIPLFKKLGDD